MRYHMHHLHMPNRDFLLTIEHLFCDKRFWLVVGIVALVAGALALAIWAGQGQAPTMELLPFGPMYPYIP
jgi:hypothetical protein